MYNPASELSSIAFDKIIGGALNAVVEAQNNSSMTTVNFIKNVGFENDSNGNTKKPVYVDFKYPKEVAPYRPAVPETYYIEIVDGGAGYTQAELDTNDNKDGFKYLVDGNGTVVSAEYTGKQEDLKGKELKLTEPAEKDDGFKAAVFRIVHEESQPAQPAQYQEMTLQVPLLTIVPIPFIRVATTDIEFNVKINSINTTTEDSSTNVNSSVSASANARFLFARGNMSMSASVSHQKKSSSTEDIKKEYSLNIKIHAVQDEVPVGMSRILDILEESIVPRASRAA